MQKTVCSGHLNLMKYTVKHTFNFPLKDVLAARENRYKHLDKFPDLQNVTMIEERQEAEKIFQKRKVSLAKSLPAVLQSFLKDPNLIEESVFDLNTSIHTFRFYPPGNEKVVTITGKSIYKAVDDKTSERVYDVEVKSEVFLVSALVEAAIEEIHKHSLEKDKASILKFLSDGSIV